MGFNLAPCGKIGEIDSERGVQGVCVAVGLGGAVVRGGVPVAGLSRLSGVTGVRRLSSS